VVVALMRVGWAGGCGERLAAMEPFARLVGEARLGLATALLHTVQDLGVLIGPAIGALLLAVAPAWVAFVVNGATFAVSALLISTMRPDRAPAGGRAARGSQLAGGLAAARASRGGPWLVA